MFSPTLNTLFTHSYSQEFLFFFNNVKIIIYSSFLYVGHQEPQLNYIQPK